MNVLGFSITRTAGDSGSRWGRRAAVMVTTAVMVVGSGVAFAYWSANGTGSGAAKAGTASPVSGSVETVASSTTLLYPGGTAPLIVNVHNPNNFSVSVSSVSLAAGTKPDSVSSSQASCTTSSSGVSLLSGTAEKLPLTLAGGADVAINVPGGVTMATTSDNGCQGATFGFTSGISVTATAG